MNPSWFSTLVHCAPRLFEALPVDLPESIRAESALGAARASVEAGPERSSYLIDYAKTHRVTGGADAGARLLSNSFDSTKENAIDWSETARGYIFEWGTCEGESSVFVQNIWLVGLSISDQVEGAQISWTNAKLALAGLGVAFAEAAEPSTRKRFTRARAACAWLGFKTRPDAIAKNYFEKYRREVLGAGGQLPTSVEGAVKRLAEGIEAARKLLDTDSLPAAVVREELTFDRLAVLLR